MTKAKDLPTEYAPCMWHILGTVRIADRAEYREGMEWYPRTYSLAESLDSSDIDRASAVIAVLSANTAWPRNVTLARRAYDGTLNNGTLPGSIAKVKALLSGGDPSDIVAGPKIVQFWHCIRTAGMHPTVPIDRHALHIAIGRVLPMEDTLKVLKWKVTHPTFHRAYSESAESLGILATQVQAVSWVAWRNRLSGRQ